MTDGFEQWVIGLPVWFQTPLVLGALTLAGLVVTTVLLRILSLVLPPDDAERRAFGAPGTDDADDADDTDDADREGGDLR